MRNSIFDFPHTCPKINKAIDECSSKIYNHLYDIIIKELEMDINVKKIKEWSEIIYDDIEDCFETVRETNENMREEAEKQLKSLKDELEDTIDKLKNLEVDI